MMQAQGMLFLSKTRPQVTTALDGTFALTLLAFDRIDVHQVEPWRISYFGPEAQAFWAAEQAELLPGRPIYLQAHRVRTFGAGRFGSSEVTAVAAHIRLERACTQNPTQNTQKEQTQ